MNRSDLYHSGDMMPQIPERVAQSRMASLPQVAQMTMLLRHIWVSAAWLIGKGLGQLLTRAIRGADYYVYVFNRRRKKGHSFLGPSKSKGVDLWLCIPKREI